jgi:hypothetical protein
MAQGRFHNAPARRITARCRCVLCRPGGVLLMIAVMPEPFGIRVDSLRS